MLPKRLFKKTSFMITNWKSDFPTTVWDRTSLNPKSTAKYLVVNIDKKGNFLDHCATDLRESSSKFISIMYSSLKHLSKNC